MNKTTYNEFINNILVNRGRFNIPQGQYRERHHIIPRCKGGSDEEQNLIDLYANEHFIAHKLLSDENPDDKQYFQAYYAMAFLKNTATQDKRVNPLTPQEYEQIKIRYIQNVGSKCAKVDLEENIIEIYSSYHEAARSNGFTPDNANVIKKVCDGNISSIRGLYFRNLDENNQVVHQPFKSYKNKKSIMAISVNNPNDKIEFCSVSEAARSLVLNRQSIGKCLQGNARYSIVGGYIFREIDGDGNIIEPQLTSQNIINEYNKKNPVINGERHNIQDWCVIYNITPACYYNRLKQGYDEITALTMLRQKPGRKVI